MGVRRFTRAVAALALAAAPPAQAKVAESSAAGFTVTETATVAADPMQAWDALAHPARWWNSQHSWSGDAANLTLDPAAGGCFCEQLPASAGHPAGSVEHMRVIYAAPGQLLRMRGALGPLQSEALTGTLTVTLKPVAGGTQIGWAYVVGGHARFDLAAIAPDVDQVLGEQLGRLADLLGAPGSAKN